MKDKKGNITTVGEKVILTHYFMRHKKNYKIKKIIQ